MTERSPEELHAAYESEMAKMRTQFDRELEMIREMIRLRIRVLIGHGVDIDSDLAFCALTNAVTCMRKQREAMFGESEERAHENEG